MSQHIAEKKLHRPDRSNALNEVMWQELRTVFLWADSTPEVRIVVLRGADKNFCSGIDLSMLAGVEALVAHRDPTRSHEALRVLILVPVSSVAASPYWRRFRGPALVPASIW